MKEVLIADKETAIKLLSKSPAYWKQLDESLKMDPEVIMHYQPSGYVCWDFYKIPGLGTTEGIFSPTELGCEYDDLFKEIYMESETTPQLGFYCEVIGNKYYFLPIEFLYNPELKAYKETYIKIQEELMKNSECKRGSLIPCCDSIQADKYDSHRCTTTIFDRTYLSACIESQQGINEPLLHSEFFINSS